MFKRKLFIPPSEVVGSRNFKLNNTYKIEFENDKSPIIIDKDGNKKELSFMTVFYLNYSKGDMGKNSYWFVICKTENKEILFHFKDFDTLPYEVVITDRKTRKETTLKNPTIEINENSLNIF